MKQIKIVSFFLFLWISLYSCKSLQQIHTSADYSNPQNRPSAQSKDTQLVFLDNISATPGAKSKPIKTTTAVVKKQAPKKKIAANDKQEPLESIIDEPMPSNYRSFQDLPAGMIANTDLYKNIELWWGTPYCMGGSSEKCIDCSAFTKTLAKDVYNFEIPRTADQQYRNANIIKTEDLKEGDLVFFSSGKNSRRISHVGVYLNNYKFIHASTSSGVMVSDLNDIYWKNRFFGAGRMKN